MAEEENSGFLSDSAYPRGLSAYFLSPPLPSPPFHSRSPPQQHSPADAMPARAAYPLSLGHWDHTAALGLTEGPLGKGNTPATQSALCSLPTEPVLAKLIALSVSCCLIFKSSWALEKCSSFHTQMLHFEVREVKLNDVLVERPVA